jgi:hypothetical protein
MIPSWRKRKALERKRRDLGLPVTDYRDDGYLAYCPNCGHRFDRTGHRFSCGGRLEIVDEIHRWRGGGEPPEEA